MRSDFAAGEAGAYATRVRRPDAEALESARLGFHRSFPARSAKRRLFVVQALVFAGLGWAFVNALREWPAVTLAALHVSALLLFAATVLWRLLAASNLTPVLSRIAEPAQWPVYTVLCPLYREANVVADLVAALEQLDYPGLMPQSGVVCDTHGLYSCPWKSPAPWSR